jgi:general stress protein YciG
MEHDMAEEREKNENEKNGRGFASMSEEERREIAKKGGESVPDEKRSFSQDRELASEAGRKGGESVPDEKRSFSQDRELASEAGHKGGESRGKDR